MYLLRYHCIILYPGRMGNLGSSQVGAIGGSGAAAAEAAKPRNFPQISHVF